MAKKTVKTETSEQYYWRVFDAKKNNEEWARKIPFDMSSQRSIKRFCLTCGSPKMGDDAFSGSECKKCGVERLTKIYGYSEENALKFYENRENRKAYSKNFYEMARNKKISNTKRSEMPDDLPF